MARILYGVMGDSRGHLSRSLAVAQHMKGHEYLFVGAGQVREAEDEGFDYREVPMMQTVLRDNKVDALATLNETLKVLARKRAIVGDLVRVMEEFDPDLILTDYEYFTPLAARKLGRPCVSLDHQHVLTHTKHDPPKAQRFNRFTTNTFIKRFFSKADHYLVSSFYEPPSIDPDKVEIFPPVLRADVKDHTPTRGDHALVYLRSAHPDWVRDKFKGRRRKYIVYGRAEPGIEDNLEFKAPSRQGFLEDLASCAHVVSNGGHSLLSESLYYGKPVLCFPSAFFYEQYLNCHFVQKLGYGRFSTDFDFDPSLLDEFESRLQEFVAAIGQRDFWGNDRIAARLGEFLERG